MDIYCYNMNSLTFKKKGDVTLFIIVYQYSQYFDCLHILYIELSPMYY